MRVFLGRTGAQDSSLWYRRPRQPRPSSSTSTQRIARSFLLLAVLFILVVDSSTAQTKSQSAAGLIYERCHSSVVVVVPLDKDNKPLGQGSGFIIAPNRVVTNHHVLADAASAAVSFADGGMEVAEGIVADNAARDITIVCVNTGTRAPLKLGDELSLKQGDEVYAIGAPRGLDLSITNGIVSGFRSIKDQFLLQSTAAIAPGSSGGPLFDSNGGVIGVTTSLLTDSPGIYFSVGIGDVARIMRSASTIALPISSSPGNGKVDENAANRALAQVAKWIDNTFDVMGGDGDDNTGSRLCSGTDGTFLDAGDFLKKWDWSTPNWHCDERIWFLFFDERCVVRIVSLKRERDWTSSSMASPASHYVKFKPDTELVFNLHDIDPSSIKSTPTWDSRIPWAVSIDFRATNDENLIGLALLYQGEKREKLHPVHALSEVLDGPIVMKPDYAPRFIKAFRTAVESCGGESSAF